MTNQGDGASPRGRGTWLARWASDLRLGVRLAIGGGRTSKTGVARLVLGTIGIGLAVAVLLLAASAGPIFEARSARVAAQFQQVEPRSGVDPLYSRDAFSEFRGADVLGRYVRASGPTSPLPPGLSRVPGNGEIVVSRALADLLGSPEGELLRPRFPQRVVGAIDPSGVADSNALIYYAGDTSLDDANAQAVYGFGGYQPDPMPASLVVLIAIGTVVLLVPVFVFISTSARIAGAERDRRLAALRLVGADAKQARRIAAAESLVGAVTGLAFGIGLFLAFRSVVGDVPILGVSPYPSDVSPPWPLVLLIVLAVPALAVGTAMVALRRTIIEPLGVVRRSRPVRRRLWWRLLPVIVGPILLLSQGNVSSRTDEWMPAVVIGAALLLFGIPAMLPWLLERAVAKVSGGRPAAQLAFRRLQLDSGTPARVVSGVAVVLAGAIALQAVLASQAGVYVVRTNSIGDANVPSILVSYEGGASAELTNRIRAVAGVRDAVAAERMTFEGKDGNHYSVSVVDCEVIRRYAGVERCTDGEVFQGGPSGGDELTAGQTVTLVNYGYQGGTRLGDSWTVPGPIRQAGLGPEFYNIAGSLLATPGAFRGVKLANRSGSAGVWIDDSRPDVVEHLRNALGPLGWRANVYETNQVSRSDAMQLFLTIQNGLLGGAVFTLLLAGVSMLVMALEQVRERRRPLAALAATGVPTGTLARSLLWQNTVPLLIGVIVAVLTGIGLSWLVFRLIGIGFTMDWGSVGMFSAATAVLVLVVTALTLPTLRNSTRLTALRTE